MSSWLEQGVDVANAWHAFSVHAAKCESCRSALRTWWQDASVRFEPQWLRCCEEGRALSERWQAAVGALAERWASERRRKLAEERQ
jgi:hypothetical protein